MIDCLNNTHTYYIGYSSNKEVRFQSSSGGVCKSFLHFLLEQHYIDYAIVTGLWDLNNPLKPETIITNNTDLLLSSKTNSIYAPTNPLKALLKVQEGKRYAFVGLPCHIRAVRAYANIHKTDILLISLLCNHTPKDDTFIDTALAYKGIDKKDVSCFLYRGHGWPGSIYIRTHKGQEYLIPFGDVWAVHTKNTQMMNKCKKCSAVISSEACLSVGDAWSLTTEQNEGTSLLISSSSKMNVLLQEAVAKKYLSLFLVSCSTVAASLQPLHDVKLQRTKE